MPKLAFGGSVDLEVDEDQLKDLSLGDEVRVVVTGKVIELRAENTTDYGDGDTHTSPPRLEVKADSVGLDKRSNEFTELAESEM